MPGHVWCAVYVADAWRCVDAHLAKHYFSPVTVLDEHVTSPRNNKEAKITDIALAREDEINSLVDFFFLTDPYEFIYFNLPDNREWQLLAQQIFKEMFHNLVALTPTFFIEQIATISEAKGIVETGNGKASITVTLTDKHNLRVLFRIRRLVGITSIHKGRDGELRNYCFLQNDDNKRILNTSLSDIGRYQIVLYILPAGRPNAEKREICHYFLDVACPDFKANVLQYNPRVEYGPGSDTKRYGIATLSHHDAMIHTDEGELEIQFQCSQLDGISLHPELSSRDIDQAQLKQYMLRSLTDDGFFTCYIRLPEAGRYLYKLMVQDMNNGNLVNVVCSYLITSTTAYCEGEAYPEGVGGYIGDVTFLTRPWLKAVSHADPMVICDETGEINISMETSTSLDLQTQLELFNAGGAHVDEDLAEYTWFVYRHSKLELQVTFPEAGQYTLSIFAKPRGDETVLKHSWIYVITVKEPHEESLPFPTMTSHWSQSCDLRQPLCGYLQEAKNVTFDVRIPEAEDVAVLTDTWASHPLARDDQQDEDGWWKGTVMTGSSGTVLSVAAMFDSDDYTYLLEYQVTR